MQKEILSDLVTLDDLISAVFDASEKAMTCAGDISDYQYTRNENMFQIMHRYKNAAMKNNIIIDYLFEINHRQGKIRELLDTLVEKVKNMPAEASGSSV